MIPHLVLADEGVVVLPVVAEHGVQRVSAPRGTAVVHLLYVELQWQKRTAVSGEERNDTKGP